MKLNKWTLGLMAVGLISLSVNAEEKAVTTPLLTSLSSTTIGGYVDTSAYWNPGTGNLNPAPFGLNAGKQDGFNLDQVLLSIAKPLEEGQWSAGYQFDMAFGPDSGLSGDPHIRQAFITLRAPVGNGLDIQVGRWDTIVGYESNDSYKNPNFTKSYGWTISPTEHDGVLLNYRVSEMLTLKGGVANAESTSFINARTVNGTESQKAYMVGASFTAPDSSGFLKGSTLNISAIHGAQALFNSTTTKQVTDLSVNGSLATPLEGLRVGAAWDELFDTGLPHTWTAAGYLTFKPSSDSKLSFNARGEYFHGSAGVLPLSGGQAFAFGAGKAHIWAATGTIQYDLWQNVLSRLEVRWDHSDSGKLFGNSPTTGAAPSKKNDVMIAANIIYKF